MAKNPELEELAVERMYQYLKTRSKYLPEDKDYIKSNIRGMGEMPVDNEEMVRRHFLHLICNVYDFTKPGTEKTTKQMYENILAEIKQFEHHKNFEKLLDSGVVDNRFGYYITSFDKL